MSEPIEALRALYSNLEGRLLNFHTRRSSEAAWDTREQESRFSRDLPDAGFIDSERDFQLNYDVRLAKNFNKSPTSLSSFRQDPVAGDEWPPPTHPFPLDELHGSVKASQANLAAVPIYWTTNREVLELQKKVLSLRSLQEDLSNQLHRLEEKKILLTEQKVASQRGMERTLNEHLRDMLAVFAPAMESLTERRKLCVDLEYKLLAAIQSSETMEAQPNAKLLGEMYDKVVGFEPVKIPDLSFHAPGEVERAHLNRELSSLRKQNQALQQQVAAQQEACEGLQSMVPSRDHDPENHFPSLHTATPSASPPSNHHIHQLRTQLEAANRELQAVRLTSHAEAQSQLRDADARVQNALRGAEERFKAQLEQFTQQVTSWEGAESSQDSSLPDMVLEETAFSSAARRIRHKLRECSRRLSDNYHAMLRSVQDKYCKDLNNLHRSHESALEAQRLSLQDDVAAARRQLQAEKDAFERERLEVRDSMSQRVAALQDENRVLRDELHRQSQDYARRLDNELREERARQSAGLDELRRQMESEMSKMSEANSRLLHLLQEQHSAALADAQNDAANAWSAQQKSKDEAQELQHKVAELTRQLADTERLVDPSAWDSNPTLHALRRSYEERLDHLMCQHEDILARAAAQVDHALRSKEVATTTASTSSPVLSISFSNPLHLFTSASDRAPQSFPVVATPAPSSADPGSTSNATAATLDLGVGVGAGPSGSTHPSTTPDSTAPQPAFVSASSSGPLTSYEAHQYSPAPPLGMQSHVVPPGTGISDAVRPLHQLLRSLNSLPSTRDMRPLSRAAPYPSSPPPASSVDDLCPARPLSDPRRSFSVVQAVLDPTTLSNSSLSLPTSPVRRRPVGAEPVATSPRTLSRRARFPGHCTRCGAVEGAAGPCAFHPYLLKNMAPFLYTSQWKSCREARHTSDTPACCLRPIHDFPQARAPSQYRKASPTSPSRTAQIVSQPRAAPKAGDPQPRQQVPQPAKKVSFALAAPSHPANPVRSESPTRCYDVSPPSRLRRGPGRPSKVSPTASVHVQPTTAPSPLDYSALLDQYIQSVAQPL